MTGTPDDRYFEWLYSRLGSVRNRNPARSYWGLYRQLYTKEFIWLVANDDNRVEDGKELRHEFVEAHGSDGVDPLWLSLGCSMLEMLIALSCRASFESDMTPGEWFYSFLQNLGLDHYTDENYKSSDVGVVDEILDRVIYRTYLPDGIGGLFPLRNPSNDQRTVELWYQLAAYLIEVESL